MEGSLRCVKAACRRDATPLLSLHTAPLPHTVCVIRNRGWSVLRNSNGKIQQIFKGNQTTKGHKQYTYVRFSRAQISGPIDRLLILFYFVSLKRIKYRQCSLNLFWIGSKVSSVTTFVITGKQMTIYLLS